ncbi:alkaline phosphatase family protein [Levilactobacillus bambusae]|uniref:Alkaline phosphatase family protein n=1 Tax=Levilactobacillus bambusae TaxID=2024736 RepID=A0A2V1N4J2_9LACO|nr:ectonucleotide pyrophosphatase/phosphodiesterase [Levilactobacillus bambusae]PWG00855.1 alkaline phosphatase family protein [Levilactobacillus bambusae]
MKGNQHLIVISVDALAARDLATSRNDLPNINQLIKTGTWVKAIDGIYPSLTYPSHTTIMTGRYPSEHGIVNNTKRQPNRRSPDWFWYQKSIQTKTLYGLAHDVGYSTASFLWPVTAGSEIDYNLAEIFPNRIWTSQTLVSLHGSSSYFLWQMNHKFGHLRNGIHQPELDNFITACAIDTIKTKQPNLTMIHLVGLDSMRHRFGVQSKEANAALQRQDEHVGQIIQAVQSAGLADDTNIVLLGDHDQIDVTKMIRLNVAFRQAGWLRARRDGAVKHDWHVWAKSCDGSTYVYTHQFADIKNLQALITNVPGVAHVYTKQEAVSMGADPDCTFMVEADRGYYFTDEAKGSEIVLSVDDSSIGQPDRYRAVHGYSPDKANYATTMVLNGPAIIPNRQFANADLIDEAPTFARLLGLRLSHTLPGHPLDGVFKP